MSSAYLGNVAFWVSDFEKSHQFYSEIIGVDLLGAGDGWAFYGDNAFNFSINKAPAAPQDRGWAKCPMNPALNEAWDPYFTIYVPNLQEVVDRCRQADVPMRQQEPFSLGEGFGISIEVKSPDGMTLALTQNGTQGEVKEEGKG